MKEIHLTYAAPDEEVDALAAILLDDNSYDTVISEDCRVYKPNGDLLLVFCKDAIPTHIGKDVYDIMRKISVGNGLVNRLSATSTDIGEYASRRLRNGKISKTTYSNVARGEKYKRMRTAAAIIGYYDRYTRIPYCRLTSFNENNMPGFQKCYPLIKCVDNLYAKHAPDKYKLQRAMADRTSKDFVIRDTAYTTVTVNKNWQTAVHKDKGDYIEGFGNISCLRGGHYSGGYTVFPKYRVAFNLGSCDVAMMDVHEWHGNTPIVGKYKQFHRISLVCYYRSNMIKCGTLAQEIERAKKYGAKGMDIDIDLPNIHS